MRPRKPVLTENELEIMKLVWKLSPVTVRDVYEELRRHRKVAYTTVMTMMGILEEKGHLLKKRGERAYVYRPAKPQHQVLGGMVKEFLNRVFDGSAKPLLVHLAENRQLSREELDELARLLDERKEGAK